MFKRKFSQWLRIVFTLLITAIMAVPVMAESIRVPIQLDYPILQQLMRSQMFNTASKSVEVLRDPTGCSRVFLSNPRLRENNKKLQITTHLKAKIATDAFGSCRQLFNWEGDARFITEPVIQAGARSIMLKILSTQLYNQQGQLITGPIWEIASGKLLTFMNHYVIDLSPTINQLNGLLPDILNKRSVDQINKITNSLKLAAISIQADGINVAVELQVDRITTKQAEVQVFSTEEMQQFEDNWHMMDAMITFVVKHYANVTKQPVLRETLAEILLDARYRLVDALTMNVTHGNDPVRHWFIDSWQQLGPILRQISLENPNQEPMLLVSLLTATDALAALDRLGPSIGLDISANGLRNMGRMLNSQSGIDPLLYEEGVDPVLRQLFQLSPSLDLSEPSGFNFNLWPISSAWAASPKERLKLWVPSKNELPEYLLLIRDILEQSSASVDIKSRLDSATKKIFQDLVLTTAWQESCWRQYVIKDKKVVPLHSSTGDSGLMQINERVWRGLYDVQKLRWDVAYNAQAGTEILHNYLVKYAIKRGEHKHSGGLDNLARSTYSAYNGGPSKTSRYRDPKSAAVLKKIDAAFWKKYQIVKQGKELQVAQCLGIEESAILNSPTNKLARRNTPVADKKPTNVISKKYADKTWILAQNKNHYTLQLAVFSSLKAAQKFITETPLQGSVAVAPLGNDKEGQFVVVNGSFKNKASAEKAKLQYPNLKPWVRQLKDIQIAVKH